MPEHPDNASEKIAEASPELAVSHTHVSNADASRPFTALRPEDMIGQLLGNYEILSLLGTGGMSAVYKARHQLLGHNFAVKLLLPDRYLSDAAVMRFQQEAKAMIKLNSPYVVPLREFAIDENGRPYLVADLAEGETLSAMLKSQVTLSPNRAASIGVDVCLGLEEAHRCRIVHRDLKPSNIIVGKDPATGKDCAKLLDFGIAKTLMPDAEADGLTKSGEMVGSPFYMSPEQCRALPIDERTDIYSLGCSLFECVRGTPPFKGTSFIETLSLHMNSPSPPLNSGNALFDEIVSRCLEKDRDQRYQNAAELKNDLNRVAAGESAPRKRKSYAKPIVAGVTILLAVMASALMIMHNHQRYAAVPSAAVPSAAEFSPDITQRQIWLWPEPPMRQVPKALNKADHEKSVLQKRLSKEQLSPTEKVQLSVRLASVLEKEDYAAASEKYKSAAAILKSMNDPNKQIERKLVQAASLRCLYKAMLERLIDQNNVRYASPLASDLEKGTSDLSKEMSGSNNQKLQSAQRGLYFLLGNAEYFLGKYKDAAGNYEMAFQLPLNTSPFDAGTTEAVVHARLADCYRANNNMVLAGREYDGALNEFLRPAVPNELNQQETKAQIIAKLQLDGSLTKLFPLQITRQNIAFALAMETLIRVDNHFDVPDSEFQTVEDLNQAAFGDLNQDDNATINLAVEDAVASRLARKGSDAKKVQKIRDYVRSSLSTLKNTKLQ